MKKTLGFALCLFLLPSLCLAAKLTVTVPAGVREVQLLSGGTWPVLTYLRTQLKNETKIYDAQYRVSQLTQDAAAAKKISEQKLEAYRQSSKLVRKEYIDKLTITITKVDANISTESSLGEVSFTYTATNRSDRIIANITYVPRIGRLKVPVPTQLMLEFIDPVSLKFGLAPGRSLSNKTDNPERLSFMTSELSKADLAYVKANIGKSFAVDAQDIRFMYAVDYKDQSKILTAEQAFAARLAEYRNASDAARREAAQKARDLAAAQAAYSKATQAARAKFEAAAAKLKKSSVRFTAKVDDDTCKFKDLPAGAYLIYASSGKSGVIKELKFSDSSEKVSLPPLAKDPFQP